MLTCAFSSRHRVTTNRRISERRAGPPHSAISKAQYIGRCYASIGQSTHSSSYVLKIVVVSPGSKPPFPTMAMRAHKVAYDVPQQHTNPTIRSVISATANSQRSYTQ
jgi:hypothetical protein